MSDIQTTTSSMMKFASGRESFSGSVSDLSAPGERSSRFSEFTNNAIKTENILTADDLHKVRFNRFARVPILDPWNQADMTRDYVFFTKPDLNIFASSGFINPVLSNTDYFPDMMETHPNSLKALQQTYISEENPYNYLLSNYVSAPIDFPGKSSETTQGNQNLYGINTFYQDNNRSNEYGFDFSVEFTDTMYHDVYTFFEAYQEYRNLQYEIDLFPPKGEYARSKIRYKSFSVYKITVDSVNRILFYGKHIGVEPLNTATDTIDSVASGEVPRFTISFKAFHSVVNKPWILQEINTIATRAGFSDGKILNEYDKSTGTANREWPAVPVISAATGQDGRKIYLLKWGRI